MFSNSDHSTAKKNRDIEKTGIRLSKQFFTGVSKMYFLTYGRGDSMIFKISWAADLSRSGTVWFRSQIIESPYRL